MNSWNQVCLVGLGMHAKTKLLPSLLKLYDDSNISLVSSSLQQSAYNLKVHKRLEDSFEYSHKNTLYIISSPPKAHLKQAKLILNAGFDVMVEKPCFLNLLELKNLINLSKNKNKLLIEMMMYFENNTTGYLIEFIEENVSSILNITSNFTIPSIPTGTFRKEQDLNSSLLADIGCYPLSFLAHINKLPNYISTKKVLLKDDYYIFELSGSSNESKIDIKIGKHKSYQNNIKIKFHNKTTIEVSPFYYGRPGKKHINISTPQKLINKELIDGNAYEKMFAKTKDEWFSDESKRFSEMLRVTDLIERIASDLWIKN